jgi:hypothetical protein
MDAKRHLETLARQSADLGLDAVMIGNAAAHLRGAPVVTMDVDFTLEHTPENYRKLAVLAQRLHCRFTELELADGRLIYQLANEADDLHVDFHFAPSGLPAYGEVKARSTETFFAGHPLRVAALEDVIASKRAANRPKDIAVLWTLEQTLAESKRPLPDAAHEEPAVYGGGPDWPADVPRPIRVKGDPDQLMIRSLLRKPMSARSRFLSVRRPDGALVF